MIETLKNIDAQLLLFFNHLNNSVFDFFFYWVSDKWIWIPFYAYLAWLLIKKYNWQFLIIMLFIAAAITISDQLASTVIKANVQRFRPCHDPAIMDQVHLVNGYCGGQFGFISSHAANTFALIAFLSKLLINNRKLFIILWIWASVVSFSRIYLGAHFPGDVIGGTIVGVVCGSMIGILCRNTLLKLSNKKIHNHQ